MQETQKIPEKVQTCINNIVEKKRYKNFTVDIRSVATDGAMGQYYEINIKDKSFGDTSLFIKHIIDNRDEMKIYNVADIFRRESFAYTQLFKLLIELQDEAKIPKEKRFKTARSYDGTTEETIVLENLANIGFKTYDRMNCPPLMYVELCVEQLAKFHALTFVIQVRKPEFFAKIREMKQPFIFAEDWIGFVNNMFNLSMGYLEDDVRTKVSANVKAIVDKYPQYMQDTATARTLCHGDYRHANVMAKEINEKPAEVIPIDFQLLHYGCPIIDFLYFIFSSTDHYFRAAHLDDLKSLYYKTLTTFLQHFLIEVKDVYPKEEFDRDYKNKLDFGLMINMFYIPFQFASKDNKPDVTNELSTISFKIDDRFRERLRGTVDEYMRWGYL